MKALPSTVAPPITTSIKYFAIATREAREGEGECESESAAESVDERGMQKLMRRAEGCLRREPHHPFPRLETAALRRGVACCACACRAVLRLGHRSLFSVRCCPLALLCAAPRSPAAAAAVCCAGGPRGGG